MTNQTKSHQNAGFTLLEVLITIVIIGISVTSVMMLQQGSALGNTKANRTRMAAHIIEQSIENLRIRVLNDPTQLPISNTDSVYANGIFGIKQHYRDAQLNGNNIPNARMVHISVYWANGLKNASNALRYDTVRVSTAIARNF